MENVICTRDNGVLTIRLIGRIDSTNASAVEKDIDLTNEDQRLSGAVIDCERLEYISSAGLRVILRVKKTIPDTTIVNVSGDVYDILDMTGFTEMMTVEKAYRLIDVEGCEVIGQGANGKVYRIDRDTIVKVYLNPDSLSEIHRERELARTAFVLGVPTAIPYDVVRIKSGGYGSVFELLNAKSFAKLLISGEMSVEEVTAKSVELLKIIHSTVVKPDQVPDMRAIALHWTDALKGRLPEESFEKLCSLLAGVPDSNHMLHGDYHFKNVMLQNGETLLIDMDTICRGDPVFEFGSIFNAYLGYSELDPGVVLGFLGIDRETAGRIWRLTLEDYFPGKSREELELIEKKARIVGYTRSMRRAIRRGGFDGGDGSELAAHYGRELTELVAQVDRLTF